MGVNRITTKLPGVCILEPVVHGDDRGYFMETYNQEVLAELGIDCPFVQDNQSFSSRGVVRALHYQIIRPQSKLVRVLHGEVFDVAVDIRRGSPTFGQWTGVTLSGENKRMFFLPEGFAHGFCVVSETAEFFYKCSDFYCPEGERGVIWNDPEIGIDWPLAGATPQLSSRDAGLGTLATRPPDDLPVYEGDPV